jgi:hypothetical protein
MKKVFCKLLAVTLVLSWMPARVMGGPATSMLIGVVYDTAGLPVPGMKVIAKDPSGKIMGEAITDTQKPYVMRNLATGQYQLTLDPLKSPFKGQTVLSSLGAEGLTVNWLVSVNADALATATPGVDDNSSGGLFGLSPMATGGLIFLGGAGLISGILAAAGVFEGNKSGTSSQ